MVCLNMNNVAFLFPGQGAQYVGMGKDLYEKSLSAKEVFDKADNVLGFSISSICFDGSLEELTKTKYCQPALLTVSIAAWEAAKSELKTQDSKLNYAAGLSLGEYSALVAAGAITFEDALLLVKKRAEFMTEAAEKYPGKMLAVIGLEADIIESLCNDTDIEIANRNCPGQIVVTGNAEGVKKFLEKAQEKGAKRLIELEVSGAFHSRLMQEASLKLKTELEKVNFNPMPCAVVSNVTAKPFSSAQEMRQNLALQVKSPVLWEDSVRFIMAQGVRKFFEIGPGKTLKGILRKIDPGLEVVNIEKTEDVLNLVK